MSKNPLTPAIRFSGYTDAWERRQLGEIAQVRTGYPFDSMDFADKGEFLVVTNGNIQDDNPCVDNSQGNHIDVTDNRIISQYVLDIGDILVTMDGTVGRTAKVAHNQMILAQRVGRLTSYGNEEFLYQALTSGNFSETMTSLSHGGTIKHISLSEISNYNLFLPEDEIEQKKVGLLFQRVDRLITLHQRKYEKLVNLKKAMLDKMFPKNGELVPEVRFAGFSGNWERRKLGEIACKVTEKNYAEAISETFTNSAENGIISQREYFDHDISNPSNLAGYFVVQENDFIYNPRISSTAPVGPVNRNKLNRKGLVSPIYTVFRTYEIDNLYLEYFFKTRHWHPYMFYNGDSGARSDRFSIKDSLFMSMPIVLPSQSEQKSIGRFLECVDSIIMLQHQKLERLQNLKKAFLEKMFV